MRRRRFLALVAVTPTLTWVACRKGDKSKKNEILAKAGLAPRKCRVETKTSGPGRVLSQAEWVTLEAICERIYPAHKGPGATDANVVNYIDAQLQHPPVESFLPVVQSAIRTLDRFAKLKGRTGFGQLSVQDQDVMLKKMQGARAGRYRGTQVMRILVALTLEGVFGDPIYGGNKDGIGWKSIGFTPQTPAPRCPYRYRHYARARRRRGGRGA
ncbi:MAG: gluconate 2-dehydrogenase subunit 3 family protein [Deltaproteobacteria bacterium]|nr:gluconate 2-dehydrogenase subunit 3 family protein [Deltaproteobacteria bacterium]